MSGVGNGQIAPHAAFEIVYSYLLSIPSFKGAGMPPRFQEDRKNVRRFTRRSATLSFGDQKSSVKCVIWDISKMGASGPGRSRWRTYHKIPHSFHLRTRTSSGSTKSSGWTSASLASDLRICRDPHSAGGHPAWAGFPFSIGNLEWPTGSICFIPRSFSCNPAPDAHSASVDLVRQTVDHAMRTDSAKSTLFQQSQSE